MSVITETARQRGRMQSLVEAAESSTAAAAALEQLATDPTFEAWAVRAIALELHAITLTIEAALAPYEPGREQKPDIDEGWYDVELMGHRRRVGYLRTIQFAGRQMIEITEPSHPVDAPKHTGDDDPDLKPALIEYYAPSALFSISPTTERAAIADLIERDERPF